MRTLVLAMALILAACGSSSSKNLCDKPALSISNLTLTPASATVAAATGSVDVTVEFDYVDPDDKAGAVNVQVQDSSGRVDFEVWDTGLFFAEGTYSLEIPVSTTTADVYTISAYINDLCDEPSNTLQAMFEVLEAADIQNDGDMVSGAILGSETFDATQIDLATVSFGLAKPQRAPEAIFLDANGDGFIDCVFELQLSDTDSGCCEGDEIIVGKTHSGESFAAAVNGN